MYNKAQAPIGTKKSKGLLKALSQLSGVDFPANLRPVFTRYGIAFAQCGEQNFQPKTPAVAINFNDKILITNPTIYYLGLSVVCVGIIAIIVGIITHFTGDFFLPASLWCVIGMPTAVIGGILIPFGLTKNGG
jgi:hypothetical protein